MTDIAVFDTKPYDRGYLAQAPGAERVFIGNASCGKLIEATALITALKSVQIGVGALDVYEEEESICFEDLSAQVLHDDEMSLLRPKKTIIPTVVPKPKQA